MNNRLRVPSVLMVIALVTLGLTGCSQRNGADGPNPESAPSSASTSAEPAATAVAANLLQLCDHAQDAFRSGGLDAAAQNAALASELQGMMDVAEPDAAEVLRPMAEAAGAIGRIDGSEPMPELQRAMNKAHRALRRDCISAGSQAWD